MASAVAVQAPVPDKTVYVVVVKGLTETVPEDAGFVPLLAVQTNGPAPLLDKVVDCPLQIVVKEGVIVIDKAGAIDTVATAVAVQAPVPDNTVYDVVVEGVTVTVAALAGVGPELAVQTNGAEPPDVNVTLSPKQIVEKEGVIVMDGVNEIETVATAEVVQAPVPDNTV